MKCQSPPPYAETFMEIYDVLLPTRYIYTQHPVLVFPIGREVRLRYSKVVYFPVLCQDCPRDQLDERLAPTVDILDNDSGP